MGVGWGSWSWCNNTAKGLRPLGTSKGALVTQGGQKRKWMRTLAKGAGVGRKELLCPCPQLVQIPTQVRRKLEGNSRTLETGRCSSSNWSSWLEYALITGCVWETLSGSNHYRVHYLIPPDDHHHHAEKECLLILRPHGSSSPGPPTSLLFLSQDFSM